MKSDPYGSAMSRAAIGRIACAAVSLVSLALPWEAGRSNSGFDLLKESIDVGAWGPIAHIAGCLIVGGVGVYLCVITAAASRPLTSCEAYGLWGIMSRIEAVGLLAWGLLVSIGAEALSSDWRSGTGYGLWLDAVGFVGCLAIHVVDVPRRMHWARSASPSREPNREIVIANPSEPARAAFAWIARRRLAAVVAGVASFALPWSYTDVVVLVDGGGPPGWGKSRPWVFGIEMLFGKGMLSHLTAWAAFTALCILFAAAAWTLQRSRWPEARRSSQMETFAGWLAPLPLHLLALMLWWSSVGMTTQFGPLLVGAWLSLVALLYSALLTLALSPLVLFRALRRRAATDMQAHLEERDASPT